MGQFWEASRLVRRGAGTRDRVPAARRTSKKHLGSLWRVDRNVWTSVLKMANKLFPFSCSTTTKSPYEKSMSDSNPPHSHTLCHPRVFQNPQYSRDHQGYRFRFLAIHGCWLPELFEGASRCESHH